MNHRLVDWQALGIGYPPADAKAETGAEVDAARSAFDVLAPCSTSSSNTGPIQIRCPVFETGHEETPTVEEVWALCVKIAKAVQIPAADRESDR